MKIREIILPDEQAINEEWYKPWTWWDDPKGGFPGDPKIAQGSVAAGAVTGVLLNRISKGRAVLKAQKLGPVNPKFVKAPYGIGSILWIIGVAGVAGEFYADMTALDALYMSGKDINGGPYTGADFQKDRQMREGLLVAQMTPLIVARLAMTKWVSLLIRALLAIATLGVSATGVGAPVAIAAGITGQVFIAAATIWLGSPEGARWITKNLGAELITVGTLTDSFWTEFYETVTGKKYYDVKRDERENPNGVQGAGPKDTAPASNTPGADWIGNTAVDPRQVKVGDTAITDINGKLIPGVLNTATIQNALKNNTDNAVAKIAKAKQLATAQ